MKRDHFSVRSNLSANLRLARALKKFTQEELAHRAGLHRTGYGVIERSVAAATIDTVERLANALGVAPYVLIMPPSSATAFVFEAISSSSRAS